MITKNLIIAADDFGASEKANRNILKLAESGKLGRVSVMTEGQFSPEDIERLKKTGVKIDVHLDLFNGIEEHRRGIVSRLLTFFWGSISSEGRPKEVKKRWEKQFEQFMDIFGKAPDGLTSHQHIHFFPFYFKTSLNLAQKYHLDHFRFGRRLVARKFNFIFYMLKFLKIFINPSFEKSGLETTEYMMSSEWISDWKDLYKYNKSIEFICHPEKDKEFEQVNNLTPTLSLEKERE